VSDSNESPDFVPSPFDRFPGENIEAGVVSGGDEPRLFGYSIDTDLGSHYSFEEIVFLLLTGELPKSPNVTKELATALVFAMPITIADASVHAARVGRHIASISNNHASVVGTASVGLAEQARYELLQKAEFRDWLCGERTSPLPEAARATNDADRARVEAFSKALPGCDEARFAANISLDAAILTVLWDCGLREERQLLTALVMCRLPVAVAEAYSVGDPRLWKYPLNLPQWVYEPGADRVL